MVYIIKSKLPINSLFIVFVRFFYILIHPFPQCLCKVHRGIVIYRGIFFFKVLSKVPFSLTGPFSIIEVEDVLLIACI